jgi:hypothetical protein
MEMTIEQEFAQDLNDILEAAGWPEFVRHAFCTFSTVEGCTSNGRRYRFPDGTEKLLVTEESDVAIVRHEWH